MTYFRLVTRVNGAAPRTLRLERLDAVISQAARSGFYRRRRLSLPECAPRDEDFLESCLEAVPTVELREFLASPAEFYNWDHKPRPLHSLECPLGDTGKTALLAGGFEESGSLRSFPYAAHDELEEFAPDSLAGPVHRLCALAEDAIEGRLTMRPLRSVVIAFTGLRHGCLKQEDRDLLWRAFQAPVFEQFRGFSQELLAWECEAHDGLHIQIENAIFEISAHGNQLLLTCLDCAEYSLLRMGTEMTGRIVRTPCGCGDASPRLMGLRVLPERRGPVVMA
ncbi:MAG: hypothetical protein IANPNBLG_03367 [Bryobacteraceae bacterium]|nr:hypothetical protein [Bryobacteraceae bacterium]